MARSLEEIVRDLSALTADQFDYRNPTGGLERLDEICDDVLKLPVPSAAFPEFFLLMERLPDADFGSPGSLVHTMEKHIGSYEDLLAASVARKPTDLTIWMVNRVLNGKTKEREKWMGLLVMASSHPAASEVVRDQAKRFIEFQKKK